MLSNKFKKKIDCKESLGTQLQEAGMNLMRVGKPQAFCLCFSGAVWSFVCFSLQVCSILCAEAGFFCKGLSFCSLISLDFGLL